MSHYHTILGQMLQLFSRFDFQKADKATKTEYHARGFCSWNHFVALLFGQLSGQDSLRGIEAGLASQAHALYHFGVRSVHRSTLAYANAHLSHELFFKALKQQLKVKSFVGNSKNALLSQLWVALTAYLLLSYLKFKSTFGWSLYTLVSILPTNLFARRNLWDWLNAPYHPRSNAPPAKLQCEFSFS